MKQKTIFRDIVRILGCVAAGVLLALNYRTFVYTGGLLPGGFAGLTMLLQNVCQLLFGYKPPYSPIYFLLNLFPIALGFSKIGKKFTIYSCITILITGLLTDVIPVYVITYDPLLISIFGGIVNGFAISLCLNSGATSGGTDFISVYLSEKFGIEAWNYILAFNAVILTINGILFGWDKALYSIIFQFVTTQILKLLYKRYQKNTMLIVTDHPEAITDAISRITRHGATDIHAVGSYNNAPRTLVYSVVSSEELKLVMNEIKVIDPDAFVNVIRTDRIRGRFYMRAND